MHTDETPRHLQNKQPLKEKNKVESKVVKKDDYHFHVGEKFMIKGRVFRLTKIKPKELTMKLIKPGPTNAARRRMREAQKAKEEADKTGTGGM